MIGCGVCNTQLIQNQPANTCYTTCKNTNFTSLQTPGKDPLPIVKGVVEPDKGAWGSAGRRAMVHHAGWPLN